MTKFLHRRLSRRQDQLASALALALFASATASAASGDLDPTYAASGTFQMPMSSYGARVRTGALQPDGKLLLAGWSGVGYNGVYNSTDFGFTRFLAENPDPYTTPNDTGFGDGTGRLSLNLFGFSDEIVDMVHTDAGIYAIGFSYENNTRHQVLLRLTDAGLPDATFGDGGKILLPLGANDSLNALSVQPDGKLVAVGQTWSSISNKDFFIARFLPDGTLDGNNFGNGGKTPIIASYGDDAAFGVTVQPDGKILVVGEAHDGGPSHTVVLRMTSFGGIDYAFGTNGFARVYQSGVNLYGRRISQAPDGRIVIGSEGLQVSPSQPGISVARLTSGGALDTTFNNGAGSRFDIYAAGAAYYLGGMALMPTGQIMVAGGLVITNSGTSTIYSARYTADGLADTTYGSGVAFKFGGIASSVNDPTSAEFLGVTPEGKVYVGGHSQGAFFAQRYQGIPVDLLPNTVTVNSVSGLSPQHPTLSLAFQVSGLTPGVRVPITVSNGKYARNSESPTELQGYVGNGDWVSIYQIAAPDYNQSKTTTVKVGGLVPSNNIAGILGQRMTVTFTTTTASDPTNPVEPGPQEM